MSSGLRARCFCVATIGALAWLLIAVGLATADAGPVAAGWSLDLFTTPTVFSTGETTCVESLRKAEQNINCDAYVITARNAGSVATDGSAAVISATLPLGVQVKKIQFFWSGAARLGSSNVTAGTDLEEAFPGVYCHTAPVQCSLPQPIEPDDTLKVIVYTTVESGAPSSISAGASVSGGGAPAQTKAMATDVGEGPASFGVADFTSEITGLDGRADQDAGGHPYELTQRIDFKNVWRYSTSIFPVDTSVEDVKDVVVDLPLGFLGNVRATPQCTFAEFSAPAHCPSSTIVGHLLTEPASGASVDSPIYNMVPEDGVAAELAFADVLNGAHALYASVVPTPAGYVLRTVSREIPQGPLADVVATLYGVPAEKNESGDAPSAMFTNPSVCDGRPLITTLYVDSWQRPAAFNADGTPNLNDPRWLSAQSSSPPVNGCNLLGFETEAFSVQPESAVANSPTGLQLDWKVLQSEQPGTRATPPLREVTVAFPPGLTVDPSSASGLQACSVAQMGWLGGSLSDFTPTAPTCPNGSKIGIVELSTPLLPSALVGSLYLAAQHENPFGSLFAVYLVIDDPHTGTIVKIPGEIRLDPQTGQITSRFSESPQVPFSELKVRLFGGSRGDVSTPESCGTFTTTATVELWSAPDSLPVTSPSDSFTVGSGCVSGFAPTLSAGTTDPRGGAYSPFVVSISRSDRDEGLAGVSVTMPRGLLAKLAGVSLCSNVAANAGSCPESSLVGSVQTAVGPGPTPYVIPGKVYLTGPYNGGPYGLAVVVRALAGPFDLGTVVVRQSLRIDPYTAQVTAASDPFPTILDGIPIRLREAALTVDRPGFTLNPTSCAPASVRASITSIGGAVAGTAARFQAAGCSSLPFKPSFRASTASRATKTTGVSLKVKITSGPGQANIAKVKVALPRQMPARLSTLQKACLAQVFEANPAFCPPASLVGSAIARTPLLVDPLSGPVYIVSHGGAAFPDVEIVLQGSGITLILDGSTRIRQGITTNDFESIPDAPVDRFELTLPQGPHSILGANLPGGSTLCGHGLSMPTTITAQNGVVVKQATKISVSRCAKTRRHRRRLRLGHH